MDPILFNEAETKIIAQLSQRFDSGDHAFSPERFPAGFFGLSDDAYNPSVTTLRDYGLLVIEPQSDFFRIHSSVGQVVRRIAEKERREAMEERREREARESNERREKDQRDWQERQNRHVRHWSMFGVVFSVIAGFVLGKYRNPDPTVIVVPAPVNLPAKE